MNVSQPSTDGERLGASGNASVSSAVGSCGESGRRGVGGVLRRVGGKGGVRG
jgi:hypothetical protein